MANIFFVNDSVNIDDLFSAGKYTGFGPVGIVRVKNGNPEDCVKVVNTDINGRIVVKASSMPKAIQEKLDAAKPGSIVLLTDEEFDEIG